MGRCAIWDEDAPHRPMAQVVYCLVAIVVLALFSLSRHETQAADERVLLGREVESAALEVAERWAARVKDRAFDEADVGSSEIRLDRTDDLTPPSLFGAALAAEVLEAPAHGLDADRFDDVDDFDGVSGVDTLWVGPDRADPLLFQVDLAVGYVDPASGAPSAAPTLAKEVTVDVLGPIVRGRPMGEAHLVVHTTAARQFLHN